MFFGLFFLSSLDFNIYKMKKNSIILFIIGILLIVATITNPNPDRHKEVMKIKLNKLTQNPFPKSDKKLRNTDSLSGMMLAEKFINKMVDQIILVDNYFLFSLTVATYRGNTKTIGFGAFGKVYITNQVDKLLSKKFYE